MIRRAQEVQEDINVEMRGGKGAVRIQHILRKDEMNGKGRLFARNILAPGTSIGLHEHVGDSEAYYILSGEGVVDDNGTPSVVKAGDLLLTPNGQKHSIENQGTVDLEFIALILFE